MNTLRILAAIAMLAVLGACSAGANGSVAAAAPAAPVAAVAPAPAETLTAGQVRKLVDALEAAENTFNADAAAALMAKDVQFVTQPIPEVGGKESRMGFDDVIAQMHKLASENANRSHASNIRVVRVAADSKSATADLSVIDSYTKEGHKMIVTTDQVYTVAMREGQPKLVGMTARLHSLSIDGIRHY